MSEGEADGEGEGGEAGRSGSEREGLALVNPVAVRDDDENEDVVGARRFLDRGMGAVAARREEAAEAASP